MKIFLDFDDVLLNTKKFKKDYWKEFEKFGIARKNAKQSYVEMKTIIKQDDIIFHSKTLKHKYPELNTNALRKVLYKFRDKSRNYIFRETGDFLLSLKMRGVKIFIVSTGIAKIQRRKIRASGLMDFFDKVKIVKDDFKGEILKEFVEPKKEVIVFIDNQKTAVEDVKKNLPGALVIQMARYKDVALSSLVDARVKNLRQAFRIILERTHISAGAIVYKSENDEVKILVMHRRHSNSYHLPKGTMEIGEKFEQTVLREIKEETGAEVKLSSYLGSVFSEFKRGESTVKKEAHYFLARFLEGDLSQHDSEHEEVFFTTFEEAIRLFQEKKEVFGREDELDILIRARDVLKKRITV